MSSSWPFSRLSRTVFVTLMTLGVSLASASCGSDTDAEATVEGDPACDNLDESACMFPFPSDYYRKSGGPFGQAFHLDFGTALPVNHVTDIAMSPEPFMANDGYPIVPAITFALQGATLNGAPPINDIGASQKPESKTIIVDAETGERAPHWVEFDYQAKDNGKDVMQIRVANGLQHGHRYVVIVRGLVDAAGAPVPATRGFAALRDKTSTKLAGIEERRTHFENDIFPVIEKVGVARSEVQLAWDFTTSSQQNATGRLLSMRDRLYDLIGDQGPEYSITNVVADPDGPEGPIAKILEGVAKIPNFMQPPVTSLPRRLRLDAQGLPVAEGTADVKFRVQIPRVALTSTTLSAVVQYGHGFLGGDGEANNSWLRNWAAQQNFLVLSTDMQGMNTAAGVVWFVCLPQDATCLATISEEPLQGVINHFALQRLMKGRFLTEPNVQKDGKAFYDPSRLYYDGNSQGGTMGNLVFLPSRDLPRAVLGVPGVAIGFLLARATQWEQIAKDIGANYLDPLELAEIMDLVQLGWDKTDAINFAPLSADALGAGSKSVLLQTGLEDAQVNNDVTHLLARLYKAKLVAPPVRPVFGLDVADAPLVSTNVLQEVDFGVPIHPESNRPAVEATDTHEKTRRTPKLQEQAWHFLETGEVLHTCDGICDPE